MCNKEWTSSECRCTNGWQRWDLTKFGSGGAFIRRDSINANLSVRSVVVEDL